MVDLKILGPAELRDAEGRLEQSFLSGPKRLGLLAYLALDRHGFKRRDSLLPLFWPRMGQKSARNALSNMLYQMRRALGDDIIINRGKEEIELGGIRCDVTAFEEAIKKENYQQAFELYRGNLLEGLHVPDASQEFDQWLDLKGRQLRQNYREVLESLARQAEKQGDPESAAEWWYKHTREEPYDSNAIRCLMEALVAVDKRPEAIRVAQGHARLLEKELGANATEEIEKLTDGLDKAAAKFKNRQKTSLPAGLNPHTIAVLPFDTVNGNGKIKPLATGIHNDLLAKLSKISALTVIARTSVRRYLGTNTAIVEIARELGVGTVVEGSMQQAKNRIQLSVQLTNIRNEQLLWAEKYDRKLTAENIFDIQSELAMKVMEALQAKLTLKEKKRVEQKPTKNLTAYRLYAQGRSWLDQRTEKGIRRARDNFNRAIDNDPDYALAYAGLADALSLLYDYGFDDNDVVLPRAEEAAQRALKLDPDLPEAHASLGLLYSNRHNGPQAIEELKQAAELHPGYAEAHNWQSWVCLLVGKGTEALNSAKKACNLDPLSPEAASNLSLSYLVTGESEKALEITRQVCNLQPNWTTGPFYEGLALYHLKRFEEAKPVLRDLIVPWAGVGPRATLALAQAATGNKRQAEKFLTDFKRNEIFFGAALIHAALGEKEQAFNAFNHIKKWESWPTLSIHHFYSNIIGPLSGDPRFSTLFSEMERSWGMEATAE